jgi:hypothetical protein
MNKVKQQETKIVIDKPRKPVIKWVNKAQMWCKTSFVNDKQVQQWYTTKEEAEGKEKNNVPMSRA